MIQRHDVADTPPFRENDVEEKCHDSDIVIEICTGFGGLNVSSTACNIPHRKYLGKPGTALAPVNLSRERSAGL